MTRNTRIVFSPLVLPQWIVKIEKRLSSRNIVQFAWVYPNKKYRTKRRWVIHTDYYWVQIHFNMFCLFIWLNKEINLSHMDFTSILVITEVIFEFYWGKILCKWHILRARPGQARLKNSRAGPGWTKVNSSRASIRKGWVTLDRAGLKKSWTTLGRAGPQKSGSFRALFRSYNHHSRWYNSSSMSCNTCC